MTRPAGLRSVWFRFLGTRRNHIFRLQKATGSH